jgi:multicomponent Na+:H+ antiporter subunit G
MADIIFILMMLNGIFFILTAALGIVKFRDIYTRLHAATKAATFGFAFIIMAVAMQTGTPTDVTKALAAVLFQFLTAPIAAHMLGRVAIQRGIRPILNPRGDTSPSQSR